MNEQLGVRVRVSSIGAGRIVMSRHVIQRDVLVDVVASIEKVWVPTRTGTTNTDELELVLCNRVSRAASTSYQTRVGHAPNGIHYNVIVVGICKCQC